MDHNTLIDIAYVSSVNLENNKKTCLIVYDIKTGASLKNFRGPCISKNTLVTVGLKDYLLSSQKDKPLLQCWEINKHDTKPIRMSVSGRVTTMIVDPVNNDICVLGIAENIYVYQLSSGLQVGVISSHYQNVTCLKFLHCGNYFASGAEDGFIYLWSMANLFESLHKVDKPQVKHYYALGQHSDKVTGLGVSGSGMSGLLVSCSADRTAKVFEMSTGRLRHNLIASVNLTSVCCNLLGSQIFLGGQNGRVNVVNLLPHSDSKDLQVEGEGSKCNGKEAIEHLELTITGDCVLTGTKDGEVQVYSVVMCEKGNKIGVASLAFQRTLHTGRGAITNILVRKMDRTVFDAPKLDSKIMISPFINQPKENILDAAATVPIRRKEHLFDPSHFTNLATQLMLEELNEPLTNQNAPQNGNDPSNQSVSEVDCPPTEDFSSQMSELHAVNQELFKHLVKQLTEKT